MKMSLAAILALVAGLVPSAVGQVARPAVYVWSSGGRPVLPSTNQFVVANNLIEMSRPYNYNGTTNTSDPAAAADWAVADIVRRLTSTLTGPDQITEDQVRVSLAIFGLDSIDCDSAAAREFSGLPHVDGAWVASPLRFFTESDRLPLNFDGTPTNPSNPNGLDSIFGFPAPPFPRHSFGRTYRNPVMLHNARADGPLRLWMLAFCDRFKAIQGNPTLINLPASTVIPDPKRFYLDNETHNSLAWLPDDNALWMLNQLAKTDLPGTSDDSNWWNYWANPAYPIPGNGGLTLYQLYQAKRTELSQRSPSVIWPEQIQDTVHGGIDTGKSSSDNVNRPFMIWYADVCRKARDAVSGTVSTT